MEDSARGKQQPPKHRACDECRSRKLACTKEPNGCSRCLREGVVCHYSPQKPMGRPRKRPCPDDNDMEQQKPKQQQSYDQSRTPSTPVDSNIPTTTPILSNNAPPIPVTTQPAAVSPAVAAPTPETFSAFDDLPLLDNLQVPMDTDWTLLDDTAGNMNFLDYMNLDPNQPFDPDFVGPDALSLTYPVEEPKPMSKWQFGIGGLFDGGTFNQLSLAMDAPAPIPDMPAIPDIPSIPSPETSSVETPSLASDSSQSSPADNPSPRSPPAPLNHTPCICLANMYLALDRLQNLPSGVRDAMCAARYGARVAHDCMQCSSCSIPLLTQVKPSIQCHQNMMILGALLPVIANAYMHIVPMVDKEAQKATDERRKLFFSISEFGGVWGRMAQESACSESEALQGDMEPILWRQIVRAMLKLDVYGMDCGCSGEKFNHLGLRDVVDQMEERSIKRHKMYEAPDVKEAVRLLGYPTPPPLAPGEKPPCLQIVGMAKKAVENIVIP